MNARPVVPPVEDLVSPPAPRALFATSSVNAAAMAAQLAFRVLALALLAAALGPAGQGTVTLGHLVATVGAGVLSLGVDVAVMRTAAIAHLRRDAHHAVWTQALVAAAVAIVAAAAVLVAAEPTTGEIAVAAGFAALPGLLLMRLAGSCAVAESRYADLAALTIVPWAVYATSLVVLQVVGALTPTAALLAFVVTMTCLAVAAAAATARWLRIGLVRAPWKSETYATGIRVLPGMLAHLANFRLDQLAIAALLSREDLGLYAVAVAASEVGMLPAQAVANAVLPQASQARPPTSRVILTASAVTAALVLCVAPPFVLVIELGLPRYEASLVPFFLLLPGTAALAVTKVLAAYVTGRGSAWDASRVTLLTLAVTASATLALIPLFGLAGAAIASSVAYGTSAYLMIRAARKHFGDRGAS